MLFLLRVLGAWFLLLAMVAAVIDATKSLGGGGAWIVTPLAQQWAELSPSSLEATKSAIQTGVGAFLWDPVILSILQMPTWLVFGVLGILLYWLGQKRRPAEVFIN